MCLLLFLGLFTYGLPSSRGGVYLRCYRLHGGCGFEFTSGGSCGRACIIPPKSRGHLPAVLQISTSGGAEMFMPDGMGVYTSGGFAYTRREYV